MKIGNWSLKIPPHERSDVRVGDGVLFAERSNEFLCVALSKAFGPEMQGNQVLIARLPLNYAELYAELRRIFFPRRSAFCRKARKSSALFCGLVAHKRPEARASLPRSG